MRTRKRFWPLALAGAIAAGMVLTFPADAGAGCPAGTPDEHTVTHHAVISFDATPIAISAFRPAGVCEEHPVPLVLTLHGWSGSRNKNVSQQQDLLDRGYGVVSIDSRGNGESGGASLVHHPSQEIKDFQAVLDWIHDELDWVEREDSGIDKDIVVGARGGSYGGGFQLMLAAFDERLDAMMPDHTWYDLPWSLAPNDAIKVFATLLYVVGKEGKRLDERIDRWYAETMVTNRVPEEARENFIESSPKTYAENLRIPTFLHQGMIDTLFPINEAAGNFLAVTGNGAPAWLVGRHDGHLYPAIQPTGISVNRSDAGCDALLPGGLAAVKLDFLDAFLKDDTAARARLEAIPRVLIPTEQGGCVTADTWPPPGEEMVADLPSVFALPEPAGTLLLPVLTGVSEPVTVAGVPVFEAEVSAVDDQFYLSLVLEHAGGIQVVQDQVIGVRTGLGVLPEAVRIEMGGIATKVGPGETLFLRIDTANEQYILNGNRKAGAVLFADARLRYTIV